MKVNRYQDAVINRQYKDDRIRSIFLSFESQNTDYWKRKCNTDFCIHYSTFQAEEVLWNELCAFLKGNHAYKLAMYMFHSLLEQGLYKGEYSDLFYANQNYFDINTFCKTGPFHFVFCFDDVENYILYGITSNKTLSTKHFYDQYNFVDARILDAITKIRTSEINNRNNHRTRAPRAFMEKYSHLQVEKISWQELCEDADKYNCHMFAFCFMYQLLQKGLYHGDYAEYLYDRMEIFKQIYDNPVFTAGKNAHAFMCGTKISGLNVLASVSGKSYVFLFLDSQNVFFQSVFLAFFEDERGSDTPQWNNYDVVWNFERSLNRYRNSITSYHDFNEYTFWEQIDWFKQKYSNNQKLKANGVTIILSFYRWLIRSNKIPHLFEDAFSLTPSLLFVGKTHSFIMNDYYFTAFDPKNPPLHHERIIFILRNFDKYSTKLKKEDFFSIDLSVVQYKPYIDIIIRYVLSLPSISVVTGSSNKNCIIEGLNFFSSLKKQSGYPNPNFDYFTNQEAVLYRNTIDGLSLGNIAKLNRKYAIKSFLAWGKENNFFKFDDLFFEYFKGTNVEKSLSNSESISNDDIEKIIRYMEEDARTNHTAALCLIITRLLIETKFRIGTICKLKADCIRPTVKPRQYRIVYHHKTGYGALEESIINEKTYRIIIGAINATEDLRSECLASSLSEYIFLRRGNMKKKISLLRPIDYSNYLKNVCKQVGIRSYTANNLRNTHMTRALAFAIEHNKSDLEVSILTGHKNISTTKNHYIDWKMEEMLEATYNVDLSDTEDINKYVNVADSISHEWLTPESIVENGCGHCKASKCHMMTNLPCLMCKDFVTTVEYQPYFEAAIESIDKMIQNSSGTPHDIEDLMTIKKLNVLYLSSILQKKGEIVNE